MALSSAQVTVTTTATALNSVTSGYTRIRVKVPTGGQTVFVGGSGVLSTTGYGIAAGESAEFSLSPHEVLYGVVAATTQDTHVLRS